MGFTQENLVAYWQPQLSINYGVGNHFSQNISLVNRNYVFDKEAFLFKGRQLDMVHFTNYRFKDNQSVAFGILYRFADNFEADNENELRLIQQYNFTKKPHILRYGHRFRTEQRITKSITVHRFRYRFAMDFPLQGEKLDPGELYFVGTLENLLSVAKGIGPQYDSRLTGHLGLQVGKDLKVQFGLEYRMEDFTARLPQNVLFALTTAQLSL